MVIVALLVIAIVLSGASVLMNVSVMKNVEFNEASAQPVTPDVSLVVLPPENTFGGAIG